MHQHFSLLISNLLSSSIVALGFNTGDNAPVSFLIYKDSSFELTFGPTNPSLCAFRGKIRESQDGHPKAHCWMYDMDDAGVGVDNVSWRGTLVLQRIREAADGKYDGDRIMGDLLLESSQGQEQNFKIVLDKK